MLSIYETQKGLKTQQMIKLASTIHMSLLNDRLLQKKRALPMRAYIIQGKEDERIGEGKTVYIVV